MRTTVLWLSLALLFLVLPSSASSQTQEYHMLDTEEAYTIGQGNLQTEIEVGDLKQPDESDLLNVPRVRVTYGLSDWVDVEFRYEYLVVEDTTFTDFDSGEIVRDHDDHDFGGLRIQVKMSPFELGRHRLAVLGITKLPDVPQDTGLGTDETDFTWKVLLSSDWGRLVTHLNAGMAILGNPAANSDQNDFFVWGIGGEYALTDSLTLLAEIEGSMGAEHGIEMDIENVAEGSVGNERASAGLGITGPVGNWKWGVMGHKGLTDHANDWELQVGLSRIWGVGGPTEVATVPVEGGPSPESFYNPLKTKTAYTIGEQNFRTEVAFGYIKQPDNSNLFVVPDLTLGWGLGPWADFELEFQYLKVEDTTLYGAHGTIIKDEVSSNGFGDVRVKFKASPFEFKYGKLGAQFITNLPSSDHEDALGTDEADFIAKGIFSTDWSTFFGDSALGRLSTHVNAGIAIQGNPNALSSQHDYYIWGIAAEYKLPNSLSLWAEVEGSADSAVSHNIADGDFGSDCTEARLGLTGLVPDIGFLRDWKWGLTASAGLTSHSRDWTASIGFSHTWEL